jgi:hypothetical protein
MLSGDRHFCGADDVKLGWASGELDALPREWNQKMIASG